jgi:hypothetical protein
MPVDLLRFLDPDLVFALADSPQPEPVTASFGRLVAALQKAEDVNVWEHTMDGYMDKARIWITTGLIDGFSAASALFVGYALLAGYRASGREGGAHILGFVIQLSMSEAQWAVVMKAMADDGVGGDDNHVLRIHQFPKTLLTHLIRRGKRDILREIYRIARLAIDNAARRAMRDADVFNSWLGDLAVLAAHLIMRHWLPLMIPAAGAAEQGGKIELFEDGGGRYIKPPQDENPILVHLFERDEIETLHRKEAYAAECFAHLFASVAGGYVTPEHQQEMAEEYTRRATESRIDARQWLALGKSRFEIAPYL